MTIFLEVAKKIIIDKATAITTASRDADLSTFNYARSMVGQGRNTVLSAEKRLLIDRLLPTIRGLVDGEDDMVTLRNLKALITTCLKEVAEASLKHEHTRGDTERGLESLEALVQIIFDKLHSLHLLDVLHDETPLNSLRHYSALYCAQKIADRHDLSFWGQLALHPKVSPKMGFAVEQEKLVVDSMNECTLDIEAFNTDHPRYKQATQRHVLLSIESLHHANVALCARHTSVPLPGFTFLKPDDGFLEECLQHAITEITAPPKKQEVTNPQPKVPTPPARRKAERVDSHASGSLLSSQLRGDPALGGEIASRVESPYVAGVEGRATSTPTVPVGNVGELALMGEADRRDSLPFNALLDGDEADVVLTEGAGDLARPVAVDGNDASATLPLGSELGLREQAEASSEFPPLPSVTTAASPHAFLAKSKKSQKKQAGGTEATHHVKQTM